MSSTTPTKQPANTYQGPSKVAQTEYPLIDNDPHFKRVVGYARREDYVAGALAAAFPPGALLLMEKIWPSHAGRGGFAKVMRLAVASGITGGFLYFYQRSAIRFYGGTENSREVKMDMREMVDKVKAGKPLYGESQLSPYLQGVAARQSRYSVLIFDMFPWFNFVNHSQHGVDTAKYYQQAERELAAEEAAAGGEKGDAEGKGDAVAEGEVMGEWKEKEE